MHNLRKYVLSDTMIHGWEHLNRLTQFIFQMEHPHWYSKCNTAGRECIAFKSTINGNPNVSPSFSIQVEELESNCTQTQRMKVTDGHVKTHRNCPKIRNDDFLWS
jgi:hypothetical protein